VPTRAGDDILAVAARVEDELVQLDREVSGRDTSLRGSLRVTTIDVFAVQNSGIFSSFAERYPEVTLEIVLSNTPQNLTKREADVAIRMTNKPPPNLLGKKLGRIEFAVYGARSLVEGREDPHDLEAYPWLAWDEKLGARLTEQWMRKHVPKARVAVRLDSGVTNLCFLRSGIGIAFAPCLWADAMPELQRLRDPEPGFGMDIWLLSHPDLRHTARVRAFVDHMSQNFSPLVGRASGCGG
jgi:DNA-binding transcriptional LysR family regulator